MNEPSEKILFVCTGNTCRSPMAEGILRSLPEFPHEWLVDSAGLHAIAGDQTSRETAEILSRRGIDLSKRKSRQVTDDLLEEATRIFTMTEGHRSALLSYYPEYFDKISLVTQFTTGKDVPDPIGCGKRAYQQVEEVLDQAIRAIIRELTKNA